MAVAFMLWLAEDIRAEMWVAVIPAFLAVTLLMIFVREPERDRLQEQVKVPFTLAGSKRLSPRYWQVVLLGAIFTLAHFNVKIFSFA